MSIDVERQYTDAAGIRGFGFRRLALRRYDRPFRTFHALQTDYAAMPMDEKVLVIPTERFRAAGYFHGLRLADDDYRAAILDATAFSFRPRYEVETDPSFKQLIPYIVLKCGEQVFHYRRGSAGTEKRLEALRSIGIGGHISEADAAGGSDPYYTGMMRELTEEVELTCGFREECVGFINDDRTPVGSVHLGVVHVFELEMPLARSREDAVAESGFAPISELLRSAEQFETWSQFVLEALRAGCDEPT